MHNIFISHTHEDIKVAEQFESRLLEFAGTPIRVWREGNLPVGVVMQNEFLRRLFEATAFIPLITKNYLSSVYSTVELGRMLEIQRRRDIPFIPIMFESATLKGSSVNQFKGIKMESTEQLADDKTMAPICKDIFRSLDRWQIKNFSIGTAELYLAYRILEPTTLSGILQSLTEIYNLVYRIAAEIPQDVTNRYLFSVSPEDRLIVSTVETGSSITLRLKTGWLPSFDVEEGNLVVCMPKGALSVVATVWLVSAAFNYGTSSIKDITDIQKNMNDMRIQSLQEEKLELEIKDLIKRINGADVSTTNKIDQKLRNLFKQTIHNEDILSFKMRTGGKSDKDN